MGNGFDNYTKYAFSVISSSSLPSVGRPKNCALRLDPLPFGSLNAPTGALASAAKWFFSVAARVEFPAGILRLAASLSDMKKPYRNYTKDVFSV